ncbi:MAG: hypothetical protein QG587_2029, partial [Chloroflexota bacterium]|nr:hypothetical protein [Chloroflexota bacterium]
DGDFPSPAAWVSVPVTSPTSPAVPRSVTPPDAPIVLTVEKRPVQCGERTTGQCGVTVDVTWDAGGDGESAFRIYTDSSGAGEGAACHPEEAYPVQATRPGATSATIGPVPFNTGGGERCLYLAAVGPGGESSRVRIPGDFNSP